jgi:hypothetical protein
MDTGMKHGHGHTPWPWTWTRHGHTFNKLAGTEDNFIFKSFVEDLAKVR